MMQLRVRVSSIKDNIPLVPYCIILPLYKEEGPMHCVLHGAVPLLLYTGASAGGTKGFIHGVGRGALSILTKPTLGVVDLAYFTLEGIRR